MATISVVVQWGSGALVVLCTVHSSLVPRPRPGNEAMYTQELMSAAKWPSMVYMRYLTPMIIGVTTP